MNGSGKTFSVILANVSYISLYPWGDGNISISSHHKAAVKIRILQTARHSSTRMMETILTCNTGRERTKTGVVT